MMSNSTHQFSQARTYVLSIQGVMDDEFLHSFCPSQTKRKQAGEITILELYNDQSALVGLIRTLHNLGFLILSLQIQNDSKENH